MRLLNVLIYNGLSVCIKVLTLLGINKVIAIYTGPMAYALISQLQNIINLALVFPSSALNGATVKLISGANGDKQEIDSVIKSSFALMSVFSLFICCIMFLFADRLSLYSFHTKEYSYIVRVFSGGIFLFAFNSFLLSLLNGFGEIKKYVIANIIGNIATLILAVILIIPFGLMGAMISIATNQTINVFFTFYLCRKCSWFNLKSSLLSSNYSAVRAILKFSVMPIYAAIILPLSLTIIRNIIVSNSGWISAGLWDAIWKISNIYLMIITLTLTVYLLPKLSSLHDKKSVLKEIKSTTLIVFAVTVAATFLVFLLKGIIVPILFTKDFAGLNVYLPYQLIGDVIKMVAWVFGYYFISKIKVAKYIFTETIQWVSFISLSLLFVSQSIEPLTAVMKSYLYSQCIYLFTLLVVFHYDIKGNS